MTKTIRTVKASIVMGLLLVSIFTAIAPTSSAGALLKLSSYVTVNWPTANGSAVKPIVPFGEERQLTLSVTYGVTTGAFPSQLVFELYQGRKVQIKLEIVDKPDWVTATLATDTINTKVTTESAPLTTTLTLSVLGDAPALGQAYVSIKASVDKIGPIDAYSQEYTLTFQPAYLPEVSPQYPEGQSKTVGPTDTATFPIEVQNLGNSRTTVFFKVSNVPEGWIAVVTDQIVLDQGQGSKGTAYLTVKPPKGFGYHDDIQSITVTMTPARSQDLTNQGVPTDATFVLESRGFSTPGFEPVLFIGALLAVILIIKLKRKK